jgi:hypothetical protein
MAAVEREQVFAHPYLVQGRAVWLPPFVDVRSRGAGRCGRYRHAAHPAGCVPGWQRSLFSKKSGSRAWREPVTKRRLASGDQSPKCSTCRSKKRSASSVPAKRTRRPRTRSWSA